MVRKILLLGHSFISHFKRFLKTNLNTFSYSINLNPREVMVQYASCPGATVEKLERTCMSDVEDFEPDVVVLQIGTNDLADPTCTPEKLVKKITGLVRTLLTTYKVKYVAVLQILHRFPSSRPTRHKVDVPTFNKKVDDANDLLTKSLSGVPGCRFWRHKGFWGAHQRATIANDGVHISQSFGQRRYFYSIRAVAVSSLKTL